MELHAYITFYNGIYGGMYQVGGFNKISLHNNGQTGFFYSCFYELQLLCLVELDLLRVHYSINFLRFCHFVIELTFILK